MDGHHALHSCGIAIFNTCRVGGIGPRGPSVRTSPTALGELDGDGSAVAKAARVIVEFRERKNVVQHSSKFCAAANLDAEGMDTSCPGKSAYAVSSRASKDRHSEVPG